MSSVLTNRCLHELFEDQVAIAPTKTALAVDGRELTYLELNQKANELAARLQTWSIAADNRVGLLMERSLDAVVAILAVLKAGRAYVPLDPRYPVKRLLFMIREAQISILLTHRKLAETIASDCQVP